MARWPPCRLRRGHRGLRGRPEDRGRREGTGRQACEGGQDRQERRAARAARRYPRLTLRRKKKQAHYDTKKRRLKNCSSKTICTRFTKNLLIFFFSRNLLRTDLLIRCVRHRRSPHHLWHC